MKPIYEFGPFRLDPAERLLLREGQPVTLTPKAFDLLVYLVQHHHHLAEKQALMSALWPDTIVEEANLAYTVSALRKALADGRDDGRFIETVPTRGYRFVAPVVEVPSAVNRTDLRRRRVWLIAGALMAIVATGAAVYLLRPSLDSRPPDGAAAPVQPEFRQLTANPAEIPVFSTSISPDGKYLAYCDRRGMRVQVIDTGDTQRLADTRGMVILGWNDDGTQIRTLEMSGQTPAIWDVSLVGSARRKTGLVWPEGGVSLAPDSSCFLRVTPENDLRVEPIHGSPRRVLRLGKDEWIATTVWAPGAKRAFFLRSRGPTGYAATALETIAVSDGKPSVVFKASPGQRIRVIGPPDHQGRLIAFMGVLGRPYDTNIWEIRADLQTGALVGEPRRLTDWREPGCYQITQSLDGKRVALLHGWHQGDVYVAAFDQRAARLDAPRRLTMNDREDYPTAWTPNSRSIIFSSKQGDRHMDIFQQDIDSKEPQLLVSGDGEKNYARVTGNGRWMLFIQHALTLPTLAITPPTRVMRVPIEGGIAEEIYASEGVAWPQCSLSKACIVADQRGGKIVISWLDPIQGKGAELMTLPSSYSGYILPDGTEFAYIPGDDHGEGLPRPPTPRNHIRIISLRGGPSKDIIVRGANDLENLDPLPDGSGWLSINHTTEQRSELMYITRNGSSHVLWAPERPRVLAAIPSRDSKHLAIHTETTTGNAWLMTGLQK
jgi:DNA-binding winged helix-turn-helix (wHTH) protein